MTDFSPSREDLSEVVSASEVSVDDSELDAIYGAFQDLAEMYGRLEDITDGVPESQTSTRDGGYRPDPDKDPYNTFITRCDVRGATTGPLAEDEIAVKDTIAVGGVEMTGASSLLEGYVPQYDAPIVTRILDAGGAITGKTNLSPYPISGAESDGGIVGPVYNPHDPERLPGGSSSGSAVAVVLGDVDAALGADQGGSIRIPAAWSGCVGLKPTNGLVPYTGVCSLSPSLDVVGPMARTVEKCAILLDVLTASKEIDQTARSGHSRFGTHSYHNALSMKEPDITVGILTEGFKGPWVDRPVAEIVRTAATELATRGVEIRDVSVPVHKDGVAIWNAIFSHEVAATVERDAPNLFNDAGYDIDFAHLFGNKRHSRTRDLPLKTRATLILNRYLREKCDLSYYMLAKNEASKLRAAYHQELKAVDVLAMPTIGTVAPRRNEGSLTTDWSQDLYRTIPNTAPFNVSGHPALSVPCGTLNGLPVGIQFVGKHFDEETVLQTGHLLQEVTDYDPSVNI
jgi:amidase